MARQLMAMFESFEHLDFNESPNVKFMDSLRSQLLVASQDVHIEQRLNIKQIDEIIGTMTIELDGDMIDQEFIDNTTTSLAKVILKIHQMFIDKRYWDPAAMTVLLARQFTVRCK